jgi:hypothetical protein
MDMLTCLGFGPWCVSMINTLFSCALAFVLVNNVVSFHPLSQVYWTKVSIGSLFLCVET